MGKILSLDQLDSACPEQLEIVRREWPGGIPLTARSARRAAVLGLDATWAARHLLTPPAWAEYERVTTARGAECRRVRSEAWAEYRYECFREIARQLAAADAGRCPVRER